MNTTEPEPWERQVGESRVAFHAARHYIGLEPHVRSQRQAWADHLANCEPRPGRTRATSLHASGRWTSWAHAWKWAQRADAWDAERARVAREAELDAIADAKKVWASTGAAMVAVGREVFAGVLDVVVMLRRGDVAAAQARATAMAPLLALVPLDQARQAVKEGVAVQVKGLGEPDVKTEVDVHTHPLLSAFLEAGRLAGVPEGELADVAGIMEPRMLGPGPDEELAEGGPNEGGGE